MYACMSYLYMCINATYRGNILLELQLYYMLNIASINNNSYINSNSYYPE